MSHPEYVRRILAANAANYVKGSLIKPFRAALGNGLVTSEGEHWKRQRRLMQPAFHVAQLRTMEGHITACVERAVRRWESAADAGRHHDSQRCSRAALDQYVLQIPDADRRFLTPDPQIQIAGIGDIVFRVAVQCAQIRVPDLRIAGSRDQRGDNTPHRPRCRDVANQ
ncbi:cytochrome P450 [Nocardia sp. NBC_01730]|uniref:cytochrome P450 n=1 Tax=Nocardia sp. NBC_01730 TaxID=2975998 RepID=UPI003FA34326